STFHQQGRRVDFADRDRNSRSISNSFPRTICATGCWKRLLPIFVATEKPVAISRDCLLLVESGGNPHLRLSRQYRHRGRIFRFAYSLVSDKATSRVERRCIGRKSLDQTTGRPGSSGASDIVSSLASSRILSFGIIRSGV